MQSPIRSFLRAPIARVTAAAIIALLPAAAAPADTGGAVYAWGDGTNGAVGNNSTGNVLVSTPVSGFTSNVGAVAAGYEFSLILRNGALYACGVNNHGQLGNGSTTNSGTPVAVTGLTSGVTAVTAGSDFALAIQNGAAYAWGCNDIGQLGNNSTTDSAVPVAIPALFNNVTAIAAGNDFGLAIRSGSVFSWGYNNFGQLGNGSTNSTRTPGVVNGGLGGATAIAAGASHGLAIVSGVVYAWGLNAYGELGNNSTTNSTVPVAVQGLPGGVTGIAAGFNHSLALVNGKVYAWGYNSAGQLGNGTNNQSLTAIQVDPADLTNIVAVAAGSLNSFALAADGSLWVWGLNNFAQLGLGNTTYSYATPQRLLPPGGYRFSSLDIDGGGFHVVAVLTPTFAFFNGQVPLSNGVFYLSFPSGNPFGYYSYLTDPRYLYHFDLGYEFVFDAADGKGGVYLYDFKSGGFFYTSPVFPFPYLYDFTLKAVLYYYPDPNNAGHYNTDGVRYFYRFDTGQIFSK